MKKVSKKPYYKKYECVQPPVSIFNSDLSRAIFQFISIVTLFLGIRYIAWRWMHSLNTDAMWFSVPLIVCETLSFIGLLLLMYDLWDEKDTKIQDTEKKCSYKFRGRQTFVDVFIATYNEECFLVEETIKDAKKVQIPEGTSLNIYVLDDGNRKSMAGLCEKYDVKHLPRAENIGFKAGNLCQAMTKTFGDYIVICDADTRLSPGFLMNTLGYFNDKRVAWVQTPQWFFDVHPGFSIRKIFNLQGFTRFFNRMRIMKDPYFCDQRPFYDVILRRRNRNDSAFCCGAASVHRREALTQFALLHYKNNSQDGGAYPLRSFVMHISEDIYTSIKLLQQNKGWKSVFHPCVESKMLSPQSMDVRLKQMSRYAKGSLDIGLREKLYFPGMPLRKKIHFWSVLFSYFSGFWDLMFFVAPSVYLFTSIAPLTAVSFDFFKHFIPFILANEILQLIGFKGLMRFHHRAFNSCLFSIKLKSFFEAFFKVKMDFGTTEKTEFGDQSDWRCVKWHIVIFSVTLAAIVYSSYYKSIDVYAYDSTTLVINYLWCLFNLCLLGRFILAAFWPPVIKRVEKRNAIKREQAYA